MEYFSTNLDDEFNELEKECLFSGKVLETLKTVIDFVQYEPRPKRHMRDLIAKSIITIWRIKKIVEEVSVVKISNILIHVNTSVDFAMDLLGPITKGNSFVKNDVRQTLLSDLHGFREFMKAELTSNSGLMIEFLRPKVAMFDLCGNLRRDVETHLQQAGANRISVTPQRSLQSHIPPSAAATDVPPTAPPSPMRQISTTQTADEHRIQVTGTVTEKDFHDKFKALCIADAEPLTENKDFHDKFKALCIADAEPLTEKIDYKQVPDSSLQEERYLQMGDWTTDLGDKTQFTNESTDEFIAEYGNVGCGTIGAILMLLPPPLPTTSTGTGEVQDAGICIGKPLFGAESDEERVKFCERLTKGEIHKNLWVVTAAHVVCSNLTMPAGHFDKHIAAIGAAKISEDLSKIECYDRIKSIMDLNARTDVCCLYSATTDVM